MSVFVQWTSKWKWYLAHDLFLSSKIILSRMVPDRHDVVGGSYGRIFLFQHQKFSFFFLLWVPTIQSKFPESDLAEFVENYFFPIIYPSMVL